MIPTAVSNTLATLNNIAPITSTINRKIKDEKILFFIV